MDCYICTPCRYIYDPSQGDGASGIAPLTLFEELPHTWVCPICGLGKNVFEVLE